MPRPFLAPLALAAAALFGTAATAAPFPSLSAKDLTGASAELPAAFAGEKTVVLIGFKEDHQDAADAWSDALSLREEGGIPSVGVAVISPGFSMMAPMIRRIVKGKVPDPETRERTYLSYANRDDVVRALGQSNYDSNLLAIVDANGQVQRIFVGAPSPEAVRSVRADFGRD